MVGEGQLAWVGVVEWSSKLELESCRMGWGMQDDEGRKWGLGLRVIDAWIDSIFILHYYHFIIFRAYMV